MALICACIFGIAIILSLSTGAGKVAGSTTFNRCMGQTSVVEVSRQNLQTRFNKNDTKCKPSFSTFQEVYLMYTVGKVSFDTLSMKMYHPILMVLQISELSCYFSMYRFISKHDKEMQKNKVISSDNFYKRKQKNLFSMYAQVSGFVLEMFYLVLIFCLRTIGSKYSLARMKSYIDTLYMTQFGLTSTIQIFVSSDLRLRFVTVLKHIFGR